MSRPQDEGGTEFELYAALDRAVDKLHRLELDRRRGLPIQARRIADVRLRIEEIRRRIREILDAEK